MPDDIAIRIEHVSKTFKLPHEKNNSIKSAVVNFYRRKKTFEIQQVLQDVSFDIKPGDFFGIVGRNGSGKSTLLKLIAGIYTPTGGQIHVRGSLTPFIELGVGFNPELTGRENVYLNSSLLGFGQKEVAAMYEDIVKFAELERFMDQKLKNYSSGMQVRLAFSIAIRAQSDILLLDEVLAVGDEAFQRKCYEYFEDLKRRKKTVIIVTHDMAAVEKFCNRAVLIKNGKVALIGSPQKVAEEYSLLNAPTIEHATTPKKQEDTAVEAPENIEMQRLITKLSISKKVLGPKDEAVITVVAENNLNAAKKIVCGINLYKINDPYNVTQAEYNSYTELGDTELRPGKKREFMVRIPVEQLYKGEYVVRAHLLDVDDDYKYYTAEIEHITLKVKEANASKSGSFNLAGNWEVHG